MHVSFRDALATAPYFWQKMSHACFAWMHIYDMICSNTQPSAQTTEFLVHEQNRQKIHTCLLPQALNCMRRSTSLRGPSLSIRQPSVSQPGWPNPLLVPNCKGSIVCSLLTTEKPHPRCQRCSISCWRDSNQEPQPPPLDPNTVRTQSPLHLLLNLPQNCTAALLGMCMQAAYRPSA